MSSSPDNEADWPGGFSSPCVRNREPILEVLQSWLAGSEFVLEIGSCTGQHAVAFAQAMPKLRWQPSDQGLYMKPLVQNLKQHRVDNIAEPLELDVTRDWPARYFDAVFTANTLHIMSWEQVKAFFAGLSSVLRQGGLVFIYGPFNYDGQYSSDSNAAFDASLRQRDPLSGIRDFADVAALAGAQRLALEKDYAMPANNRMLVWRLNGG